MELVPAGLDERPVRDLPHETVSEPVLGRGSASLLDHELEPLELGEGPQQPRPGEEPLEQRQAEGAPDHGRGRDHLTRLGVEPIQPRLQGFLNGGRDRGLAGEDDAAVLPHERAALAQITDRLPDEVRVPACPLGEELCELLWQFSSGVRFCERERVRVRKWLQPKVQEQTPEAPTGTVDELPGGVLGVTAMDEHEADRSLLGCGKQLVEQ
jgi:hypothetical protein